MIQYTLTMPSGTTGGTFTVTVNGQTSGAINHPATAAGLQSAIRALSQPTATVTGSTGGPFTINGLTKPITVGTANLEGASGSISITQKDIPMAGVKFEDMRAAKGKLIRKALGGLILVAPMTSEVPDKLIADAEGNLIDLSALGYKPVGWLTKGDGINFSRETEQQETESFGALEPTRIDFTKDVTSAAFKCQETNKTVLSMYYNKDLDNVKMDTNGEFSFENDPQPSTIYRRAIYLAKDGNGKDAKYIAKIMPRAIISEVQEQTWSSESELAYGLTMKATTDDELGFSVRHVFGGPGMKALEKDMGFTSA